MQPVLNGLAAGSVIAISALAFLIVSRTAGGLHLAHGAIVAWGGIVTLAMAPSGAAQLVVAAGAALFMTTLLGVFLEIGVYGPLASARAGASAIMLSSLAAYVFLAGVLTTVLGPNARYPTFQTMRASVEVPFGTALISPVQLVQVISAALICTAIPLALRSTRLGLYVRAQADDPELLEVMGGPTRRIRVVAAGVGGAMAGLVGVLTAMDVGMDANYGLTAVVTAAVVSFAAGSRIGFVTASFGILLGIIHAQIGAHVDMRWGMGALYSLLLLPLIALRRGVGVAGFGIRATR